MFSGDSMDGNNNQQFSTKNRDNALNCAVLHRSVWWHRDCAWANLNGQYYGSKQKSNLKAIYWYYWRNSDESIKRVDMKIKLN